MTAKIKLNAASGGGSFSLQAPSSSSNNRVFTLPDSADATLLTSTASLGKIIAQYFATSTAEYSSSSGSYQSAHSITFTPASSSSKFLIIYMPARVITNGSSDNEIHFSDGSNTTNQYRIAAGGSSYKSPTLAFFHNHNLSGSTTFTAKYRNISGNSDTMALGDSPSGNSLIVVLEIEQ